MAVVDSTSYLAREFAAGDSRAALFSYTHFDRGISHRPCRLHHDDRRDTIGLDA
jgi:hypothetical protein